MRSKVIQYILIKSVISKIEPVDEIKFSQQQNQRMHNHLKCFKVNDLNYCSNVFGLRPSQAVSFILFPLEYQPSTEQRQCTALEILDRDASLPNR